MRLQEFALEVSSGLKLSNFHIYPLFYLPSNDMLDTFKKQGQMPYYSPTLPSVLIDEAPCALIAKTKSNKSQGLEATLLKVVR